MGGEPGCPPEKFPGPFEPLPAGSADRRSVACALELVSDITLSLTVSGEPSLEAFLSSVLSGRHRREIGRRLEVIYCKTTHELRLDSIISASGSQRFYRAIGVDQRESQPQKIIQGLLDELGVLSQLPNRRAA